MSAPPPGRQNVDRSRSLGELVVPSIGYGAMVLSGTYGAIDQRQAVRTLQEVIDAGCTFIDTSDKYGNGGNEALVGKAVRGRRESVVIATKFGLLPQAGTSTRRIPVTMDFGELRVNNDPRLVEWYAERSLRLLATDHIDLYYPHWPDPGVPIEEVVGAVAELVVKGKVRHIGLSNADADHLRRATAVHRIAAVQTQWSMWHAPPAELLNAARPGSTGVVAWSPLGNGFLAGAVTKLAEDDYRKSVSRFRFLPSNNRRYDVVREVAARLGMTPAQLALAWLLHQRPDVVPIPGSRTLAHVLENLAAAAIELHTDDLGAIEQALSSFRPRGKVGDRQTD